MILTLNLYHLRIKNNFVVNPLMVIIFNMSDFTTDISDILERFLNSLQNLIATFDRLSLIFPSLVNTFEKVTQLLQVASCEIEIINNILKIIHGILDFMNLLSK